jgi:hypothetical protein
MDSLRAPSPRETELRFERADRCLYESAEATRDASLGIDQW